MNVLLRAVLFSLASNAAVLFVLKFGQVVWPEGLPAHSQNVLWLASGVNVAGLLILGLRYWPVILLDAFPAWLLAGEPLALTLPGSVTNALEALLAAWLVRRLGNFATRFDTARAVSALLIASLVAPLVNTVVIPVTFCMRGLLPWASLPEALTHWNLANGTAMLILAPLVLAVWHGGWVLRARWRECALFALAALALCFVAFEALLARSSVNITFLVFPVVIYAAVRFGANEVSGALGLVLAALYVSLANHPDTLPPERMASEIWFVQAFCWVLSATGLLVAALVSERQGARLETRRERERTLEISLREERARLDALRYQLDPHFLFNSLNSISATLPVSGAETSRSMVLRLSRYLRSTLARRDSDLILLADELRSVEEYLEIEKIRFGAELQTTIAASDAARAFMVPAFLLQPLVENAIVHGFASTQGDFRLEIRAAMEGGGLMLEVANTGAWKEPAAEGLGLSNTRRRLELIHGDHARFDILSEKGWVRVQIHLPSEIRTS